MYRYARQTRHRSGDRVARRPTGWSGGDRAAPQCRVDPARRRAPCGGGAAARPTTAACTRWGTAPSAQRAGAGPPCSPTRPTACSAIAARGRPGASERPVGRCTSRSGRPDGARRTGSCCTDAGLAPDEVTTLHGLPITTPARTLLDLAATLTPRQLGTAISRAEQSACSTSPISTTSCDATRVAPDPPPSERCWTPTRPMTPVVRWRT